MVTLGTDPEVFVVDRSGKVIPSYDVLCRISSDAIESGVPLPFGRLSGDGAALEWTQVPAPSSELAGRYLSDNFTWVKRLVRAANPGWTTSTSPSLRLDPGDIARLTPDFGKSFSLQMFGCSPDFCVYPDLEVPQRPNPMETTLRSAGGHVHMGVGDLVNDFTAVSLLAIILDCVVATHAVTCYGHMDGFKERMQLYGTPGMIRVNQEKKLVEYRVLPSVYVLEMPYQAFGLCEMVAKTVLQTWSNSPDLFYTLFNDLFGDLAMPAVESISMVQTREASDVYQEASTRLRTMGEMGVSQ